MDITHDNVCSSMLSCFFSHLLSTGHPISSFMLELWDCVNVLAKDEKNKLFESNNGTFKTFALKVEKMDKFLLSGTFCCIY